MRFLLTTLACLLIGIGGALAQLTTSSVEGRATDAKNDALIGATVVFIHQPTGTKYGVTADAEGRYRIFNMNPGGPYQVTTSFVSFKTETVDGLNLTLGKNNVPDIVLQDESKTLSEVVVTANRGGTRTGASTDVNAAQLQRLPTISRSLQDFTRLTPQSSNNSFAGTNFRYNNVTVDGAINNDAISFSPSLGGQSGTSNQPGSSTRTNPFSLDAIQELQVQIAPFDVKLGNFTGGSVNAVTRSGTNEVTGSVYGFGRNSSITGPNNADGTKAKIPSGFYDYQTGFRVGFPLIKNKLFFFTNEEITRRQEPVFYGAGTPGSVITTAQAQQITDSLRSATFMPRSQYNPTGPFTVGAFGDYKIYSRSNKFFNRLDWNINANHQLAIRANYILSEATNLERSSQEFQFGSYDFTQHNSNFSAVAELKSRFGNSAANSLILGYTTIHDYRDPIGQVFPQIQINNVNGGGRILLGTNREAGIFNMRQKTFEFTDNFTYYRGRNTFTLGTHNEFYNIEYGFINSYNGRIDYNSLNDFFANRPTRIRAIYNLTNNDRTYNFNTPSAPFKINLLSVYAQDEIRVSNRLVVSPGLRIDYTDVPTAPDVSENARNVRLDPNYGTTYTYNRPRDIIGTKPFGIPQFSPRFGFNFDVKGDRKLVIRGGTGLFTGRVPFAWLGNTYYNTGVRYGAFDLNNNTRTINIPTDQTQFAAFNTNVLRQPNRVELDLMDKNLRMPQMWRSNVAVDLTLPHDYKLTLEAIYTKTIYDMIVKQVNLKDSVRYNLYDINKEQPVFLSGGATARRIDNNFTSIYLLTNTTQGYRYQLTAQLSKQYPFGLNFFAAYTYGQSKDLINGIRNSLESTWQLNQFTNPNNPQLSYSNFDVRHRLVATIGYRLNWNKRNATQFSGVLTMQSGVPFTWVYTSNNVTTNGQQVDIAFIPKDRSQIALVPYTSAGGTVVSADQQWNQLNAYISNDPYLNSRRGQFTERNVARTPWNNQLDLRALHEIILPGRGLGGKVHTLQLSLDIINAINLINRNWGYQYFVPNTLNSSVSLGLTTNGRLDPTSGLPQFTFVQPQTTYVIDQLASRWQMQLGARYSF
jgi:hypothetical protein